MFSKIVLFLVVVIAAVLLFATTRPDTILVERSIVIHATPDKIFPLIDDFHNWPQWAAQDKEDPTMTRTYSGTASGAGAVSDWTSDGSAGRGEMTITSALPTSRIHVRVGFVKPFPLHNTHAITLEKVPGGTQVTWTSEVQNVYFMKVMGVFMNMDNYMGKHFEASLENLKDLAER
jgi:uncharacterized protein YndB with AHSA1/START domain